VPATKQQVFGDGPDTVRPAPMNGFVENGEKQMGKGKGPTAMACFNPFTTPVINTLAMEFALFDSWYASVPGPTEVNRMFANSGTSYGACTNSDIEQIALGYPQKPIFQSLDESGGTWKVYFKDISGVLYFRYVRTLHNLAKFRLWEEFAKDCKNRTLPSFSWLEPRYFEDFGKPASDQHPSHDVAEGERLIKEVYETIRNSPSWEDTLLLVTYDEHGGFYDHQPTPLDNIPNPDGHNCKNNSFDFTRLGVRIPTIAISPWINKGTLVHDPVGPTPYSKYDHTSTLATVKKIFNLPNFLTKRDAWAGTYEFLWQNRTSPRTDCPTSLPTPPMLRKLEMEDAGQRPLSDLQQNFVTLASILAQQSNLKMETPRTESDGSAFVYQSMMSFLGRAPQNKMVEGDH